MENPTLTSRRVYALLTTISRSSRRLIAIFNSCLKRIFSFLRSLIWHLLSLTYCILFTSAYNFSFHLL